MYAINKFVDGCLLYVHFDSQNGYFFKLGMLGCCAFTEDNAKQFVSACGFTDVRIAKLHKTTDFNTITLSSQSDTDALVKKLQKKDKKKLKKQRQKARNVVQGPDSEELPVPPTIF